MQVFVSILQCLFNELHVYIYTLVDVKVDVSVLLPFSEFIILHFPSENLLSFGAVI